LSSLFLAALRGSYRTPSPAFCKTGSSFHTLYLHFRVQVASSLPSMQACSAPSAGFLPSSRHQLGESTTSALPTARLTFRPQRFSRSRRVTPHRTLRACFIPLPRAGFASQGFSPTFSRPDSSPSPFPPLLPLACFAYQSEDWRQLRKLRLQGFVPKTDP
jgi:hypothetical protein